MIKIENTQVVGLEPAIRGMRNPMNSWDRSDSYKCPILKEINSKNESYRCAGCKLEDQRPESCYIVGENDLNLMNRLAAGGPVHAKYRRMIVVYLDIVAPLYWWKEFDTYKVGTVANSSSTMHKIHEKEFELEDFSYEHLIDFWNETDINEYSDELGNFVFDNHPIITSGNGDEMWSPIGILKHTIRMLNKCRELYLETKDKKYWWQMIQLLPSSYNQRRTVMLNYEVLHNIYISRKDHKLDEWRNFCEWIKTLPYSEVITL